MKIFAVGHQKNTGKDTFVKFCIDILRTKGSKQKIVRRGFADNLYDICHMLYGWAGFRPRVYYQENITAKNDPLVIGGTVRDLLIKFGNKAREFDKDIWINSALRGLTCDILFITDLRYPNEFLHCQSVGAKTIKVIKPGLPEPTDEADTALNSWDEKFDITVKNDGDLQALYAKAEMFVLDHIYA